MNIAVTGATGFLGRHFIEMALRSGAKIAALVRRGSKPLDSSAGLRTIVGSLENTDVAEGLFSGADAWVHLAAAGVQGGGRSWELCAATNIIYPLSWAGRAAHWGIRRTVIAGTCYEYRGHGTLPSSPYSSERRARLIEETEPIEGVGPYGATKAAGGVILRSRLADTGVTGFYLRFASLFGRGDNTDKLLPAAARAARAGVEFQMTPGEVIREWLHVADASKALWKALHTPVDRVAILNIGTGEGLSALEVVNAVFKIAGADPALVRPGARPYPREEPHVLVMNCDRAAEALDFRPTVSLAEGLADLINGPRIAQT